MWLGRDREINLSAKSRHPNFFALPTFLLSSLPSLLQSRLASSQQATNITSDMSSHAGKSLLYGKLGTHIPYLMGFISSIHHVKEIFNIQYTVQYHHTATPNKTYNLSHERVVISRYPQYGSFTTSNGGCRREEKSHKHWSFFNKFLFSVTVYLFICQIKSRAIACIDCTENQRKIGLSQMNQRSSISQNHSTG